MKAFSVNALANSVKALAKKRGARTAGARRSVVGIPAPIPWTPMPRRSALIGYGVPMLAALSASFTWFSPGAFIASGDISPFVRKNLTGDVSWLWNHQITGAGSVSYAVTQLLEVLLLRLTAVLGLSPMVAQHVLYASIFCFAAFAVSYLAGVWIRRPWPLAAAGSVAVFNAYVLVNFPNLLPVLAIGLIAALAGMLLRTAAGARGNPAALALLTLPVSYLAQNPPLVAIVGLTVIVTALAASLSTRSAGSRRAITLLLQASVPAVLVNLFWLLPYAFTLNSGSGLSFTAQTDVGAWGWTQARASIGNVISLNTHWGWNDPDYFPYAPALSNGLHGALQWGLPALAAVGLFVAGRARRRLSATLGGAALLLIAVGKGLHSPLGSVNAWAYTHLPGMWLLRDPMSKVGGLLVIVYALGLALALDQVAERMAWVKGSRRNSSRRNSSRRFHPGTTRLQRTVGLGGATLVTLLAIGYPTPLFTGAAVPGARGYMPSSRVSIPAAWEQVAATVDRESPGGKVAVFPLDPYYQITTSWGYHGVDSIPAQLIRAPVLQELPGGYFTATPGVDALLEGTETAMVSGDAANVVPRLRALGVTSVILRKDLVATPDLPPAADPSQLAATLARTDGLRLVRETPVADVYAVVGGATTQPTGQLVQVHADDAAGISAAVAGLPPGTFAVTDPTLPVEGFSWQAGSTAGAQAFNLAHAGPYRIAASATGTATFEAKVQDVAGLPRLQLTNADRVSLDGTSVAGPPGMSIPLDSKDVVGLAVGAQLLPMVPAAPIENPAGAPTALVNVSATTNITAYAPTAGSLSRSPAFSALGDCNRFDSRTPQQAGLALAQSRDGVITLSASAHTACIHTPVARKVGGGLYRVRFDYRNTAGEPARFCLWQQGTGVCAGAQNPAQNGDGWHSYSGLARVSDTATGLELFLYADGISNNRTVVEYRNISTDLLHAVGTAAVGATSAQPEIRTLAAGHHSISFQPANITPGVMATFSPLSNCNNSSGSPSGQPQQTLERLADGTVSLTAAADIACVTAQPTITNPGSLYHLSFAYRTLSGRPARVCVWQVGPNTCAGTPALATSTQWRTLDASVEVQPGTTALVLYLYADGQQTPLTAVQYERVALQRIAPTSIVVSPTSLPGSVAGGSPQPPTASVRVVPDSPGRYRVTLKHIRPGAFVVVPDSFADGWMLTDLPRGWSAQHFMADGYSNGWLLTGSGSADLTAFYRPQQWVGAAQIVAMSTVLLLILWLGARRPRVRNFFSAIPRRLFSRSRWGQPHAYRERDR